MQKNEEMLLDKRIKRGIIYLKTIKENIYSVYSVLYGDGASGSRPAHEEEGTLEETFQSPGVQSEACYCANPGFVTREVVGEVIAVPVGEQTKRLNGMITFSETGAFLWKLLAGGPQTKAQLTARLAAACGKQEAEIAEDVSGFLQKAEASGLVVREG